MAKVNNVWMMADKVCPRVEDTSYKELYYFLLHSTR